MAHGLAGMAADEVERAVMGAAQLIALELLVGFEREVAIGVEHELYALAQFLVAQKQRISRRSGFHHAGNKYRSTPIVVRSKTIEAARCVDTPKRQCCGTAPRVGHILSLEF